MVGGMIFRSSASTPAAPPAQLLYVRVLGPQGMKTTFFPGTAAAHVLASATDVGLRPGYVYRVELSNLPNLPGVQLYPSLEVRGVLNVTLAQAARRLPSLRGGKPPHPSTLFRWATAGRKSRSGRIVQLEIWLVGGTNCTSIEALCRFFQKLNDLPHATAPKRSAEFDSCPKEQADEANMLLKQRGLLE